MNNENEPDVDQQQTEQLDENYFKEHPHLWNKPKKVVADKNDESLENIKYLKKGAIMTLFSCFDLETLIKLLKVNKTLNTIVKQSETLQKFLEVKNEYIENKGKPNQRVNFGKYSVTQSLRNNCDLYAKFQKKYKIGNNDSKIIFGELLKKQIIREFKRAQSKNGKNYLNLNDIKLKEYGITLLNYAIKEIPFFRKIVLSGNSESISNFNLIKSFVNFSKCL